MANTLQPGFVPCFQASLLPCPATCGLIQCMSDDMYAPAPDYFITSRGYKLAYHALPPAASGMPTIVFCGGFRSDMTGTKAVFLQTLCQRQGYGFIRFDYFGHGASDGPFTDGTLSRWVADTADIITAHTTGPLILVGSSMGGWVGLRLMLDHPALAARILHFIGIAAAPDFTKALMRPAFTAAQQEMLAKTGQIIEHSPYAPDDPMVITRALLDDGDALSLLEQEWELATPMTLLQGRQDPDVPWHWPHRIITAFPKAAVTLHMIPDGDHRLSRPADLTLLEEAVISGVYTLCARLSAQTHGSTGSP